MDERIRVPLPAANMSARALFGVIVYLSLLIVISKRAQKGASKKYLMLSQ